MKALTPKNVSKVYGREFALHRVNLTFKAGSTTIVFGGNGAGKTTLMNLIATLDSPSDGTIQYGDVDFKTFARRGRRNIGWVSHDSLLYPELTGRENLEFYANMYGLKDVEETASHWLDRVSLTHAAHKRVRTYSRGMSQRLSIARAMIHKPAILLLDEPMTGLDEPSRNAMFSLFREARDSGHILIMITHDFDFPPDFADHIAILNQGKLAFFEPFDEGMNLLTLFREHSR